MYLIDNVIRDILAQFCATGHPIYKIAKSVFLKQRFSSNEKLLIFNTIFQFLKTRRWPKWFTDQISSELEISLREPFRITLAVDLRYVTMPAVIAELEHLGIQCQLSNFVNTALIIKKDNFNLMINCTHDGNLIRIKKIPTHIRNAIWFMDESSQIVVSKIKAKMNEKVLDFCSGYGCKTRILMATGATIFSVDKLRHRITKLSGVKKIISDGRYFKNSELFDWILVDAPCSGTGTLRRFPDIFGRLKEDDIMDYTTIQKQLVASATQLLKPNGRLLYSTCSILEKENHVNFNNLELIDNKTLLPSIEGCDGAYWALFKIKNSS